MVKKTTDISLSSGKEESLPERRFATDPRSAGAEARVFSRILLANSELNHRPGPEQVV